ncbi:diiron oxygenase [Breoghania sp.]|uniref:diiron oxygenase n=1 Tax=Breoghania sp. TaxID=2065378 RepID=UPI0029C9FC5E|nr:diiron oxygenase [Breoghania sp.]
MYTNISDDTALVRNVLENLGKTWDDRVAVRKERLDLDQYYDPAIPDFPSSLVPFWDDEDFSSLSAQTKLRFLAVAWVAYNEKAIYLEEAVVQPACGIFFRGELPGIGAARTKQVVAQIQVDEQFHILMCLDVCHVARKRHHIEDYRMPEPLLGVRLKEIIADAADEEEARIAQVAYASVAEMSINAYLNEVATDQTIQPLNRVNTDMHRQDEAAHGIGFSEIVGSVYRQMNDKQRQTFRKLIGQALTDFTTPDLTYWASILDYLGIPNRDAIIERHETSTRGLVLKRNYTTIRRLFDELEITDDIDFEFH